MQNNIIRYIKGRAMKYKHDVYTVYTTIIGDGWMEDGWMNGWSG